MIRYYNFQLYMYYVSHGLRPLDRMIVTLKPRPHWWLWSPFSATSPISANSITLIYRWICCTDESDRRVAALVVLITNRDAVGGVLTCEQFTSPDDVVCCASDL